MREVTISISGSPATVRKQFEELILGEFKDSLYIKGNGGDQPSVTINFDVEEVYAEEGGDQILAETEIY